jgi:hypothetical protein
LAGSTVIGDIDRKERLRLFKINGNEPDKVQKRKMRGSVETGTKTLMTMINCPIITCGYKSLPVNHENDKTQQCQQTKI